jgi:hypothetical protein
LRARLYDEQIRDFIHAVGIQQVSLRVVNSTTPPSFAKPNFDLDHLIAVGEEMVAEQQRLQEMRLADQYNRALRERSQERVLKPPQAINLPLQQRPPRRSWKPMWWTKSAVCWDKAIEWGWNMPIAVASGPMLGRAARPCKPPIYKLPRPSWKVA